MKSRTCQRFGSPCSRRWTQSIQAAALALQVSTSFFFPPLCFSNGADTLISPPFVSVRQARRVNMTPRLLEALLWLDASCFLRVILSWRRCFHWLYTLWQSPWSYFDLVVLLGSNLTTKPLQTQRTLVCELAWPLTPKCEKHSWELERLN